jgi:hypothetical protein
MLVLKTGPTPKTFDEHPATAWNLTSKTLSRSAPMPSSTPSRRWIASSPNV